VTYSEKEPAAKALLEVCKELKMHVELSVGEYMGFKMSLSYESFGHQINLLLRGSMTYQIELGTDAFGNITRINNALDKLPERLEGARSQLENINTQVEAAKLELAKPFAQATELTEKEARLALINADLNIDGEGGFDVMNETYNRDEMDAPAANEPNGEGHFEDEPQDEHSSRYRYIEEHATQIASAKSKPSILEGIRNFDSGKHNSSTGKNVSIESFI
jgi:hypothetical protein